MSIDFTKCRKSGSGNTLTAKGRMVYPALFEPRMMKGESDPSKAKYQLTVLFPKGADLSMLVEDVKACIAEKWGPDAAKKHKIKTPFLKTADQPRLEHLAEDFPTMIRLGNKSAPGVVGPNGKRIDDEAQVYGGRWCTGSTRPYGWEHPANGRGISFSLEAVQLLDHDERIGPGPVDPENEFEAVSTDGAKDPSDIFA